MTGFSRERVDGASTLDGLLPTVTVSVATGSGAATDLTTIVLKTEADSASTSADVTSQILSPFATSGEWSLRSWIGKVGDAFGQWWLTLDEAA